MTRNTQQAQDPELYAVNSITFHPCGTFATAGGDGLFALFSSLALSPFSLISSLALSLLPLRVATVSSLVTSLTLPNTLSLYPPPLISSLSLFRARARSLPFSFYLSLCLSNCKKADKCRAIWHSSIHFFVKALLRLYSGCIKALLRLY